MSNSSSRVAQRMRPACLEPGFDSVGIKARCKVQCNVVIPGCYVPMKSNRGVYTTRVKLDGVKSTRELTRGEERKQRWRIRRGVSSHKLYRIDVPSPDPARPRRRATREHEHEPALPAPIKCRLLVLDLEASLDQDPAMAASSTASTAPLLPLALLLLASYTCSVGAEEAVLALDAGNFSEVVGRHDFVVVEFYAPWCGHCKQLAPEYEKAASIMSKHDPAIVLAKVDANDKKNKDLGDRYDVQGFPTLKILRNRGSSVQDYNGPRDADGMVEYLKKQVGPASVEIRSVEDAASLIGDKGVVVVGVFPEFGGGEYENFLAVAEKMRADYDFRHTLDAGVLPRGDQTVKGPLVRLFKPFDELFVDSQDFDKDALEKFVEVSCFPTVVTFDTDPTNHKFLLKYFDNTGAKAMLFLSFSDDRIEAFKAQFYEAAKQYGAKNISFLIGDVTASQGALQYFGLKESEVPLIFIQAPTAKYVKPTVEPDQILTWLKEYTDGTLAPHVRSEPVPEFNDQPVKIVVADNIREVFFSSGKNVLLEFYAPWCGHCQKLAPILDEVAVTLQNDEDVVIAKMDGTANDIPSDFTMEGYPTMYLYSSGGNLLSYDGGRTAKEIIDFITKNKGSKPGEAAAEDGVAQTDDTVEEATASESIKDEL